MKIIETKKNAAAVKIFHQDKPQRFVIEFQNFISVIFD